VRVPFYKPSVGQAEIDEVVECLKSGWLTTGPRTRQFEKEFAEYTRREHAVAVNSCTAALHLALEAIGVQPGDAVLVPTMTFAATAEVVRYFNAKPLLVDCQAEDFNLDVADAERRLIAAQERGERVVAIMPVHYGGQIGDVTAYTALARKYQLKIVEDAAHCCPAYWRKAEGEGQDLLENGQGSRVESQHSTSNIEHPTFNIRHPIVDDQASTLNQGRQSENRNPKSKIDPGWLSVGSNADICCYSFYANKCLTTGEGGMACTSNGAYADRMRVMSLHGISKDAWKRFSADGSWYYEIVAPGYKYNLTDIAAAIGLHQVRRADELHRKRVEAAVFYTEQLRHVEELILPRELPDRIHSWHLYAIRLKLDRLKIDRAQFIKELKDRGIGTSVHWMPLHMHPYYREKYHYQASDYPVASSLYPELVTLPLYPDMTEEDLLYVCTSIEKGILTKS
jgi:dTDP-4-amino-4,6-dideoxygalactose transaminase